MDLKKIAGDLAAKFIPFFGTSKTIKKIGKEIGDATDNELAILWEKVRPWFIEEYEEETPIDDNFEVTDVKALLKSQLKKADEATKAAIQSALAQAKPSKVNITQNHSGSGDNVAGDKVINNNSKIGQQNNNSTVNNDNTPFNL